MNIPRPPHRWRISAERAIAVQRELAHMVSVQPSGKEFRLVAGVDAAFSRSGRYCIGGVVLWDAKTGAVVEERVSARQLEFPYVPGLLSFREAPALIDALRVLRQTPDALMCDGQGLAHPRRFGIACHMGVLAGVPTLGCGKSRLVGTYEEPGPKRGATRRLEVAGETVGMVLRTRDRTRPVFVSVGHGMDLSEAVRLVMKCCRGYRLPEPTRLADKLVARAKREKLRDW